MVTFDPIKLDPSLHFDAAELRDALAHWSRLRGERALPSRREIDPLDLRPHLGWLLLVDVLREPQRFRYRLVGTGFAALMGRDSSGRFLDELYDGETYERMITSYRRVAAEGKPMRVTGSISRAGDSGLLFETLDLPFGDDARTVDTIMTRGVFRSLE